MGVSSCLAAPLPILLPVKAPEKAEEDGPNTQAPATHVRDSVEAPGFSLAHLWPLEPSGK